MEKYLAKEDFLKTCILTNLQGHPDGRYLYYIVSTLDKNHNRYLRNLWQYDTQDKKSEPVHLDFEPKGYTFRDGYVFLWHYEEASTLFHAYDPASGKVESVCKIPFVAKTAGCGKKLYFTAQIKKDEAFEGVLSSETGPFYTEGSGVLGRSVTALFETEYNGKSIRVLTDLEMDLNLVDFDFESGRIVFTAFRSTAQKPVASCVYTYDILTDGLRKFTDSEFRIDGLKSMTNETALFCGVDLEHQNRNDNQQIYRVDTGTGQVSRLGDRIDLSNERPGVVTDSAFIEGSCEIRHGGAYHHLRVGEDRQYICTQALDGTRVQLDTGLKAIMDFEIHEDKRFLLGMKDQKLLELYEYKDGDLVRLTSHNSWLDAYTLSIPKPLTFTHGGIELMGWIYPPAGRGQNQEKTPRPGVLMVHGGPKMIYTDIFSFDVQLLCAKGYYVFYANPMGSDGRGDAFADIRGRFAALPFDQLMAFTDEVLRAEPEIDADAMGVTGGSYGGFMTNYIVTQTDRFKAAVSERGISNMLTALSSSDIGYKYAVEYAGGKASWERPEVFLEMSPIMQVSRVKTPTLFNHGHADYRCHYTESLNMYSAMVQCGVKSRLCLYEGENHGLATRGRPMAKLKRYQEMTGWFERYLKRG